MALQPCCHPLQEMVLELLGQERGHLRCLELLRLQQVQLQLQEAEQLQQRLALVCLSEGLVLSGARKEQLEGSHQRQTDLKHPSNPQHKCKFTQRGQLQVICEDHLRLHAKINLSKQLFRSLKSQSNKCMENHQIGLRRSKLQIHLEPRLANTKPILDMPTARARYPAVSSMAAMQTSCAGIYQLSKWISIRC